MVVSERPGRKPFSDEDIEEDRIRLPYSRDLFKDPFYEVEYKQEYNHDHVTMRDFLSGRLIKSMFKHNKTVLLRRMKKSTTLFTYRTPTITPSSKYDDLDRVRVTEDNLIQITTLAYEEYQRIQQVNVAQAKAEKIYGAYPPKKFGE